MQEETTHLISSSPLGPVCRRVALLLPHWRSETLLSLTGTNNHTATNLTSRHCIRDFSGFESLLYCIYFIFPFLSRLCFNLIKRPHCQIAFHLLVNVPLSLPSTNQHLNIYYSLFTVITAFNLPQLCVAFITSNLKTSPLALISLSSATMFAGIYSSRLLLPSFSYL